MQPASQNRALFTSKAHGFCGRTPARRPTALQNAIGVASEVIMPCGKAVFSAPLRMLFLLGSFFGVRSKKVTRRPRKTGGCSKGVSIRKLRVPRFEDPLSRLSRQLALATEGFAAAVAENAMNAFTTAMAAFPLSPPRAGCHDGSGAAAITVSSGQDGSAGLGLQVGSLYQNPYMSLWNNSNSPVSSVLHITGSDRFELKVQYLDSVNGGSEGWIIFRSAFDVQDIDGNPQRKRLLLRQDAELKTLEYDEKVFDRSANFMLGVLRRATWALMAAFSLEYDLEQNAVMCGPKAAILKPFWQTTVGLLSASESNVWTFDPSEGNGQKADAYTPALATA